jgi:hypothetical protein
MNITSAQARAYLGSLPGEPAPAKRRKKPGTGDFAAKKRWLTEQRLKPGLFLELQTLSEANRRDKWGGIKRAKMQRAYVAAMLKGYRPILPCVVTLTRYAPRLLDEFDNLPRSLKAVADGVCDAFGVDDKPGSGLRFKAAQEKSPHYGIRIELTPAVA